MKEFLILADLEQYLRGCSNSQLHVVAERVRQEAARRRTSATISMVASSDFEKKTIKELEGL